MRPMEPSYLALHASGELARRAAAAAALLASCTVCPRQCLVGRRAEDTGIRQTGICQTGRRALVASYSLHFGEEAPLVGLGPDGSGGSGTIFFAGCNLCCAFCQNFDISHDVSGHGCGATAVTPDQLAWIMLRLQEQGARNINLVTPSHVVPHILEALPLAVEGGLRLPLVYNSSAYDALDTLRLLDGVVDIYMPDAKFFDDATAARYCKAPDYPRVAREAIREMHAQVGDLVMDQDGMARRGLLVRHLVMPDGRAGTEEWMEFLAREVSPATYVNIMDQYRPCGDLARLPELQRPVTPDEYRAALDAAARHGITRLDDRTARGLFRLLRGV